MNPQQISALVRVFVAAALGPSSYLVASHIIPNDPTLIDSATTVVTVGGAAIVGYFSHRAHSASAVTAAVNSNSVPGVVAVKEANAVLAGIPPVTVDSSGEVRTSPPAPLAANAKPELKS